MYLMKKNTEGGKYLHGNRLKTCNQRTTTRQLARRGVNDQSRVQQHMGKFKTAWAHRMFPGYLAGRIRRGEEPVIQEGYVLKPGRMEDRESVADATKAVLATEVSEAILERAWKSAGRFRPAMRTLSYVPNPWVKGLALTASGLGDLYDMWKWGNRIKGGERILEAYRDDDPFGT